MDGGRFRRRAVLSALAGLGGGCLRLSGEDSPTPSDTAGASGTPASTPTPTTQAGTDPPTDSPTDTPSPTETVATPGEVTGSWPQYQYDAANSGSNRFGARPRRDATVVWAYGTEGTVNGAPVIDDGIAYFGDVQNRCYAVDAATGAEVWTSVVDGGTVVGSPAVHGDSVYVAGEGGTLHALSVTDGTERWSYETAQVVRSAPTVVGSTVYVCDYSGTLYALSTSGSLRWTFESDDDRLMPAPAVDASTVYVAGSSLSDDWPQQFLYGDPSWVSFRDAGGSVYAVDAVSGSRRWQVDTGAIVMGTPALSGTRLFVTTLEGRVMAIDSVGEVAWTVEDVGRMISGPAVADGRVYVGTMFENVRAFAANDGTDEWAYNDLGVVTAPPVVVDDAVYVRSGTTSTSSTGNGVYVLDAATGERRRVWPGWQGSVAPPAIVDGIALLNATSTDATSGALYAIG